MYLQFNSSNEIGEEHRAIIARIAKRTGKHRAFTNFNHESKVIVIVIKSHKKATPVKNRMPGLSIGRGESRRTRVLRSAARPRNTITRHLYTNTPASTVRALHKNPTAYKEADCSKRRSKKYRFGYYHTGYQVLGSPPEE
jgi:hypothetical protein